MVKFREVDGDSAESRSSVKNINLPVRVEDFERVAVQDARELATSMKAPTLEALVVGDTRDGRKRKVEDLLCHQLRPIALEMREKNFGLPKVNSNGTGNRTRTSQQVLRHRSTSSIRVDHAAENLLLET
jgi:hypothetical protein